MITTPEAFAEAVKNGATELELDLAQPISLSGLKRSLKLTGRITLPAGAAEWTPALSLSLCEGVTLDELKLAGQPRSTGGYVGRGVLVQGGAGLAINGCDISALTQGVVLIGAKGAAITRCDIHDVQVDGIQVQQVTDLTIAENWFRDFCPLADDHADAIQAQTNAAATDDCDGLAIRDNLLDLFPADKAQGIFLMNPRFGGHRNVSVERNLLFSLVWWGIGVNGCQGAIVRANRLFQLIGAPYVPRINTGGVPATLEANEAPAYVFKAFGDPLPPGNTINKPIDAAAFDTMRAEWLAQFRAPPKSDRAKLMDQMATALTAANDTFAQLRALG